MSSHSLQIAEQIKTYATAELGISLIGFCRAEILHDARKNLQEFIGAGFQGEMKYLEDINRRIDPNYVLPGANSVIVIAVNYYREQDPIEADEGRIARYAYGRDYHKVLKKLLKQLQKFLDANWPNHQHRLCVDSAPLMEKAYAEKAGLGFYGKNTTLISPQLGSFFLLGEILTTLDLPADSPASGTCGNCTRCLDACPTQALIAPGVLGVPEVSLSSTATSRMDARRCISYMTIETKEAIPDEFSQATKNLIMGCDICQEVCPYNKAFAKPLTLEPLKSVRIAGNSIPLLEILCLRDSTDYLARFAGSPLMRPKREGLIKNALNAVLNAIKKDPQKYSDKFLPVIKQIAEHDSSEKLRAIAQKIILQVS